VVRRLDTAEQIRELPYQSARLERFGVSRQAAATAMHLVSPRGTVWQGAEAARELLRLLPRTRRFVWLFQVPGLMAVAERVYRWIARRRHRFGCSSEECRRGPNRQSAPRDE
jgi:predicted DCC family thiol-disulfide oxidoreductase YuxK